MTVWTVTVPGVPIAKERPRLTMRGGKTVVFTPPRTRRWEAKIRAVTRADAMWAADPDGLLPFDGAVHVTLLFRLPMPKSWSAKRRGEMDGKLHIRRPDVDNLIKAALDGMGDAYYSDDCVVARVTGEKRWCADASRTGVDVRIESMQDSEP